MTLNRTTYTILAHSPILIPSKSQTLAIIQIQSNCSKVLLYFQTFKNFIHFQFIAFQFIWSCNIFQLMKFFYFSVNSNFLLITKTYVFTFEDVSILNSIKQFKWNNHFNCKDINHMENCTRCSFCYDYLPRIFSRLNATFFVKEFIVNLTFYMHNKWCSKIWFITHEEALSYFKCNKIDGPNKKYNYLMVIELLWSW